MWYTYIMRCSDNSLYTGITNDLQKRFQDHRSGRGGRYTRSRTVTKIMISEKFKTKSQALKREAEIKKWPRKQKLNLIKFGRPTKDEKTQNNHHDSGIRDS